MPAKTIMVQGTASNVGKSIVTTALCRILKRKGYRVAPFKAQNMANNSSVTVEGGEIGTAQAVQAEACGLKPSQWMNPILLKPSSDTKSQVVVLGKVFTMTNAREYQEKKKELIKYVDEALERLRSEFDIVVIEGAGSPAEINLKGNDIVNMFVAKRVSSPVILVADIDKGGVFAQIAGTFDLLDAEEKSLVKTFLINKFRGDKDILWPGIQWIEQKIQRKSLGVLPMIANLQIKEEDAVVLDDLSPLTHKRGAAHSDTSGKLLIQVIRLPRISNFTDFEPLAREPDVILEYVTTPNRHRSPDLLIIPGTKSTVADLEFVNNSGFADYIRRCYQSGTSILGICGGYQMLGKRIEDPHQSESTRDSVTGLGFLPTVTVFSPTKTTVQVKGIHVESQLPVEGYEIHMGRTQSLNGLSPFANITQRQDESVTAQDGYCLFQDKTSASSPFVIGTYIHGLFDSADFRRYFLNQLRRAAGLSDLAEQSEQKILKPYENYDYLADQVESHIDMQLLGEVLGERLV